MSKHQRPEHEPSTQDDAPIGEAHDATPFDPLAAVEAIQIAAKRSEAALVLLRREIDRAPWRDADPDRDEGSVGRAELVEHLISDAEEQFRIVRLSLGLVAERLAKE